MQSFTYLYRIVFRERIDAWETGKRKRLSFHCKSLCILYYVQAFPVPKKRKNEINHVNIVNLF